MASFDVSGNIGCRKFNFSILEKLIGVLPNEDKKVSIGIELLDSKIDFESIEEFVKYINTFPQQCNMSKINIHIHNENYDRVYVCFNRFLGTYYSVTSKDPFLMTETSNKIKQILPKHTPILPHYIIFMFFGALLGVCLTLSWWWAYGIVFGIWLIGMNLFGTKFFTKYPVWPFNSIDLKTNALLFKLKYVP